MENNWTFIFHFEELRAPERPKGLTGALLSKVKERVRERKFMGNIEEIRPAIETRKLHENFECNLAHDIALLLLVDEPIDEIIKLLKNEV